MKAKNQVLAGDLTGANISIINQGLRIGDFNYPIRAYNVVTEETVKSAASGIARGLVGGALLGPVGMLVGVLTARNKGIHTLVIEYGDGKRSLVEVDDKINKHIVTTCF